jgi:hypothetical protein
MMQWQRIGRLGLWMAGGILLLLVPSLRVGPVFSLKIGVSLSLICQMLCPFTLMVGRTFRLAFQMGFTL